ncbi:unnamed protein product [Durusdinium trenchii]|uniref:Uncharacterized protein n=2 Tax=Durusdinium trenchii TaxID=1381693 RepID=A0ABP0J2C9_9DINO
MAAAEVAMWTALLKLAMAARSTSAAHTSLDSLASAGLTGATDFIVTGESAGGLTVMLHLDFIRARFPTVNVVGMNYCGFFVDLADGQGIPACAMPSALGLGIKVFSGTTATWSPMPTPPAQ